MQKALSLLSVTLGTFLIAEVAGHAQVIASENFNYTTGSEVLGDGAAGNGWANSWADKNNLDTVQSGSLSYTDGSGNALATSGNSLYSSGSTANGNSSEPERTITGTFGSLALANTADPNTVWMSYLWLGGNTSASGSGFRQASVMFLKGASTTSSSPGGTEYMDIGMPNITNGTFNVNPDISLWTSSGNAGQTLSSTAPLDSGVAGNNGLTDFILIEMTGTATAWASAGNDETINVWINPTLTQTNPIGAPQISYSGQDLSLLNAIRLQGGGVNATYGSLPGSETVSDINIGDTPFDVEPLPEPGALGLVTLGGGIVFAVIRRRNLKAL